MLLRRCERSDPHLATSQIPEGTDRVHPAAANAPHRGDDQDVSGSQAGVQCSPGLPAVSPGGTGDSHIPVYQVRRHASVVELQDLSLGAAPRLALGLAPAGPDVTANLAHAVTIPFCASATLSDADSHVPGTKTRVCGTV